MFAVVGLVAALIFVLVGCSPAEEPTTTDSGAGGTQPAGQEAVPLEGTSWNCIEFKVNDAPVTVPADAPITAQFGADGTLSGSSGVNTYSTGYTTSGTGITIDSAIVTTKMAGPEDAMARETSYLTVLPTAVSYQVDDKNGQLVLFGPADNTIARYTPAE